MIYVDGMVNTEVIISNIIEPLLYKGLPQGLGAVDTVSQMFEQERFSVLQIKKISNIEDITDYILKGYLAIIVDGESVALLADVKKLETRSIEDSSIEPVVRGSRESFTENLCTNTTMLRRIIASPKLKVRSLKIGELTKTDVAVVYIEGVIESNVLEEVMNRLN